MLMLYLRGVVLGLAIAAPVGPIGLLCIRQTLQAGWPSGLLTGLGAATADAIYGAIAACGFTAIADQLLAYQVLFRLGGGAFLLYLGFKTARSPAATTAATISATTLLQHYGLAVALTLTNPATILAFLAIFAGLGLTASAHSGLAPLMLVGGVFSGSALWWLMLSSGIAYYRDRLNPQHLRWINRGAGALIMGFGLIAIATVATHFGPA